MTKKDLGEENQELAKYLLMSRRWGGTRQLFRNLTPGDLRSSMPYHVETQVDISHLLGETAILMLLTVRRRTLVTQSEEILAVRRVDI